MVTINVSKFCVYTHSKNGNVFYVGKGRGYRAFESARRNSLWLDFVGRDGHFDVEILGWFNTNAEAIKAEAEMIVKYKPECNQLLCGYINHGRNAIVSETHKGKVVPQETRDKISAGMLGRAPWNIGLPCEDEQKEKLRRSSKTARKIINKDTGYIYSSAKEASRALEIPWSTLRAHLAGKLYHARGMVLAYAE